MNIELSSTPAPSVDGNEISSICNTNFVYDFVESFHITVSVHMFHLHKLLSSVEIRSEL